MQLKYQAENVRSWSLVNIAYFRSMGNGSAQEITRFPLISRVTVPPKNIRILNNIIITSSQAKLVQDYIFMLMLELREKKKQFNYKKFEIASNVL